MSSSWTPTKCGYCKGKRKPETPGKWERHPRLPKNAPLVWFCTDLCRIAFLDEVTNGGSE